VKYDRSTAAFQAFLVEAKKYWMADIWGALKDDYRERSKGKTIATPEQVAELMKDSPTYWFYSWLERHIQRAKYSGRYGLQKALDGARVLPPNNANLHLRDLPVPDYYSTVDTHQHPGNLAGAPNAGLVYKASAQSTQPGATNRYALHERFASFVAELGQFRQILELGCGFGKSALPLAKRFPHAKVTAIDLSAPCLQLAAKEAVEACAENLVYEQADVRQTGYAGGSFDLVTSTMLLHELDTAALRESLREAQRVLAPGGKLVHLDFQVKDPFLQFIHYTHGRRNNEPYMEEINRLDLQVELRDAGFDDVRIVPFEEVEGASSPDWPTWRFPWAVFVAGKP
jgi:ubiquinone/menaquinone biosynthesis C-methylase UbiE